VPIGTSNCCQIGAACFIYHKISECCLCISTKLSDCCNWTSTKIKDCNNWRHEKATECEEWIMSRGKPSQSNDRIYSEDSDTISITDITRTSVSGINIDPAIIIAPINTNMSTDLLGTNNQIEEYENL